ncbi:hypothetical protein SAMN04488570_0302 [Nocardioides scoriae]|uniref:Uncharacterized protein n=1 Tax=Nocardioides scoriae TaxID=642780 RepID=A0A1H1LNZ6_9ACTN|nr:hypothetical protein [Nocardioides scoriae]SDR76283.1 hypothetical protein SAMN04488570_0302 [Nocardioides scoriae]
MTPLGSQACAAGRVPRHHQVPGWAATHEHVGEDATHTSDNVQLAITGWHCYLTQHSPRSRPQVVLLDDHGPLEVVLGAGLVAAILAATETRETREAMWALVNEVES